MGVHMHVCESLSQRPSGTQVWDSDREKVFNHGVMAIVITSLMKLLKQFQL